VPVSSTNPLPSASPPTIITTPGGLTFAVNLSNGQVIPPPSYLVTVTPLNGQGRTFAKVEFLVDGRLAYTASPDPATGTFSWRWAVTAGTQPRVTIILYDATGQTTQHDISVRISRPASAAAPTDTTSPFITAVRRLARAVPVPVAYAFPYLLLLLLGTGLILLLFQTRREVAEAESLHHALTGAQVLAKDKATLTELASHYLRTPLAVMSGGLDILSIQHDLADPAAATIKPAIATLHDQVETLLGEIVNSHPAPTPLETNGPSPRLWLAPGFLLPLVLIGGLTLGFNVVMGLAGRVTLTVINELTQIALFALLALSLYLLLRSRLLHRRSRGRTQALLAAEAEVDHARNLLITRSAAELSTALAAIKAQLGILPEGKKGTGLVRDGYRRFEQVLSKFSVAASLEASPGLPAAPTPFRLTALINKAVATVADRAQAKHLQVSLPTEDTPLSSRRPDLLATVLSSLLDNAVAYGPDGSRLKVIAEGGLERTVLTVSDEGPGLPPDKLGRLFQPFSRADGALTFNHEGMGFSLYLDKLIMHYLGGDITATSQPGRGLSVAVSFPN
jgi:signal transduction histidine kinase